MRRLRTMLFSPGHNLRMTYKAGRLGADAVILDLEDAVPMTDKETARLFIRDALPSLADQPSSVYVRINALTTGLGEEDLDWVVREELDGVILPKAESVEGVCRAAAMIEREEKRKKLAPGSLALIPLLETARGAALAREIAGAHERVIALAFGGVDYARDMNIELTREGAELAPVRARLALMAHAEDKLAIDTPWIDIHDREGLVADARTARQYGFHGKLLIHPSQVGPVNEVFSPAPEAVAHAQRVVREFKAALQKGAGAISLDGKMIDEANYRQALNMLALHNAPDQG